MGNSRLILQDIAKIWYRERTDTRLVALDEINLEILTGEFLVLLGPSGCGKSTLLQIIAELEEPSSGQIVFPEQPPNGRKRSCTVFQEYALFPWRTTLENVCFGPEVHGVPRAERRRVARQHLALVNLALFEDRYPHELSGGMKQRVALARALANDPEILLFDEPLASLDAQTRVVLQRELVRIWEQTGKTFVYVTHSLEEAVLMGSRIALMTARPGRIKEIIPVEIPRPRQTTGDQEVKLLDYLAAQLKEEVEESLQSEQLVILDKGVSDG